MEVSPYAPPQAAIAATNAATSEFEAIRQEHIKTESNVKGIGFLFYLGAFVTVAVGASTLTTSSTVSEEGLFIGVVLVLVGLAQGAVAYGLRRLQSWSRIPAILISALILAVSFPKSLLAVIFIFILAGKKAARVCAPDYQEIIAATPHVKMKTSKASIVLLVLLLLILVAVLIAAFSTR